MKRYGHKGPENHNRSEAAKLLDAFGQHLHVALRELALAGMPRAPKSHRTKNIEYAARAFDRARAHLTTARYHFGRCQERVADREKPEAADKAAVTSLSPQIQEATAQAETMRRLLIAYAGSNMTRNCLDEEQRQASEFRSSLFSVDDGKRLHCNWCAAVERYSFSHYALDAEGFAVRRARANRYICYSCFAVARDLHDPTPKAAQPAATPPKDAELETVKCVATAQSLLPSTAEGGEPREVSHHVE